MQRNARVWLEIDLCAIAHNYDMIKRRVSPLSVMPVLKADAYGLGSPHIIAQTLLDAGATNVGVANLQEALALKSVGLQPHILGALLPVDIPAVVRDKITAPIVDRKTAYLLNKEGVKQGRRVQCQILVDTGMGRLGLRGGHLKSVIQEICALPYLDITGMYSHFPHAYGDTVFTHRQIADFKNLLQSLALKGITFRDIHIANSDAINNIPAALTRPFTKVRTGINLYGIFDLEGNRSYQLKPALCLKSKLVSVRKLPAGSSIGYGKMYTLQKPSMVGVVSAGYADGIPFALTNNGQARIRGKNCPMIGRISMDYTTILLDDLPDAQTGEDVILLDDELTVAAWARKKGTHPYDVICSIGNRVQRRFLS